MAAKKSQHTQEKVLLGIHGTLAAIWPDESERPSLRAFMEWKRRGFVPYLKIGRRVFFDPQEVRRALERRFEIQAR